MSLTTAQMEQITAEGLGSRIVSQYVKPVPTITSNASQSITENELAVAAVNVLSARFDAVFTHSIAGGADAEFFTIDPSTGVPSFLVAPDYEDPQDANGDNVYEVTVRATDQYGASTTKVLSVTVEDAQAAGSLSDTNASDNEIQSGAAAGTAVTGITWLHDIPGSPLYELTDDAGGRFTIEPVTGQIQRSSTGTLGASHDVTVRVSGDEGGEEVFATATITIDVITAVPPVITSNGGGATAQVTVTEGDTAITTVQADGQPIQYSVSGTDADDVTIDADTGVLAFASAPDYSTPTDADTDNDYEFTVTASDGVRSDTQDWTVTVTDGLTGIGVVPGTEITAMRTESMSTTGVTWADASGTYGQSLTGTDWWQLTHDGTTEGFLFADPADNSAYTGLDETYFVAMEVKPIAGNTVQPGMNISGGPFPFANLHTDPDNPSISDGTGGVRKDAAGDQYTLWMEVPADAVTENFFIHMGSNGDNSPSGANALSGEAYLIGGIWIEAKGVKTEPTALTS